jgi:hypothetical protein
MILKMTHDHEKMRTGSGLGCPGGRRYFPAMATSEPDDPCEVAAPAEVSGIAGPAASKA